MEITRSIGVSYENIRTRLLRPSQVMKTVYTTPLFPAIPVFATTLQWNVSIFVTAVKIEKKFRLHTISINHGATYQSLIPFAVKAKRTDSISLHPVISYPFYREGQREVERNVQEGTKILASQKIVYFPWIREPLKPQRFVSWKLPYASLCVNVDLCMYAML